ncbi:hypothetical protein AHAS_Ahas15G0301500 [Arachis hypogaea]
MLSCLFAIQLINTIDLLTKNCKITIDCFKPTIFVGFDPYSRKFVWEVGALSKNFWFDSWLHSGPVGARVEFLDICEAALTIENIYHDGVWHLERIYSFIPRDLRKDILSLVHISASGRDLGWSWEHTFYSAKQGYLWLIQNKLNWDRNINWLCLWKARVPEKLRLLVWLHDAVPTQYLRFSDVCFFGSHEVHDWFKHGLLNEGCPKFAAIIWSIWQDRNMDNFQGVFGSPGSIAYKARRCMVDFKYTTQNRVWDHCAGFGWVIRNSSSQWVGLKLVVYETDCAAAFELVTGWQVSLWHLEKEVIQLIFELKLRRDLDIRFELIPREANIVVDRLAKMGSGGSRANEVHLWH